ncbi:MAG: hypothetical protein Q4G40_10095 [Brachybacterium sp.]|nr:hypothetical protein [Brachybacterium sp.]
MRIRRWRARLPSDEGSALVEFVVLGVLLLIPCLYLVLTLAQVQSAVFAADIIARDAARTHATEGDPAVAAHRAEAMNGSVREDFGLPAGEGLAVSCSEDPCATAGGTVTATVSITVPVPGLGPILGQDGPVRVSSDHMVVVDQHSTLAVGDGP